MLLLTGFVKVSQNSSIVKSRVITNNCVTVELTYVTSEDYVININDLRNTNDFIDHPLPKDSVAPLGASHHAWVPGSPPSKSGARDYS